MKYPKITALLGLSTLSFHSTFGIGKNHVRLTEEECQKLEDHFSADPSGNVLEMSELQSKFDVLQNNYNTLNATNIAMGDALDAAINLNDLKGELGATATPEEAITLLGAKCKEYGTSENRHSFPNNNGITAPENGLINNIVDMNDAHNKINL